MEWLDAEHSARWLTKKINERDYGYITLRWNNGWAAPALPLRCVMRHGNG
jgi:hypothetical protein